MGMRWSVFIVGAGLLCIGSWIDNLRGPILPTLAQLYQLDYGSTAIMVSVGNLVAMASTWLLMPLLNRWSIRQVGVSVLIYTCIVSGATVLVKTPIHLYIWGAMIGGAISTMGSLSNIFVQSSCDARRRGQIMSALHSLYGLSSLFAPWVAGLVLTKPERWPILFASMAPITILLAFFTRCLPLQSSSDSHGNVKSVAQPMSIGPIHTLTILVLVAYVLGEVLISTWMTSFLIETHKLTIKEASVYTSLFFAVMLVTRIACSIFARPPHHRLLLKVSLLASLTCFIGAQTTGWLWLLPLAGLLGPFFPLYVTWVGLRFPERDRSLVLWMLSMMQASLAFMNYVMGAFADWWGFKIAYLTPAVMLFLGLILLKILELWDFDHPRQNA